ncbi:hypothetical protein M9H77_22997 [Catharanthus roseus]|uniref:Uncharacterized protein n=1 Tax=Catharanthus roseus TaxID=4058 RepID=A0ACC0AU75_CATRO|nr:hypothetical protein M9H77_22997 [Catharanthus roseus]
MLEIYSQQTYKRTYQANFHPVLSENFWRDVPFNLTFYPPNMKKEWGRKQDKQFQGEIDYRNPDSPPRCGRYRNRILWIVAHTLTKFACSLSSPMIWMDGSVLDCISAASLPDFSTTI